MPPFFLIASIFLYLTSPSDGLIGNECASHVVSYHGKEKGLFENLIETIETYTSFEPSFESFLIGFKQQLADISADTSYCKQCRDLTRNLTYSLKHGVITWGCWGEKKDQKLRRSFLKSSTAAISSILKLLPKEQNRHSRQLLWNVWIEGLIRLMESPYNYYVYADELTLHKSVSRGKAFSPGFSMDQIEGRWLVNGIWDAFLNQNGMKLGDEVLLLNGYPPTEFFPDLWVSNQPFSYEILIRNSNGEYRLDCQSRPIRLRSILWEQFGDKIYVQLKTFSQDSLIEFRRMFRHIPSDCEGIIIDVRGNSGGQVVPELVDCFFKPGETVMTIADLKADAWYHEKATVEYIDTPVAILIDRETASMAELFVAAFKQSGRGRILGETSYGKGVGQTIFTLGNEGLVGLVQTRYYYPGTETSWDKEGICPDERIELSEIERKQIERTLGAQVLNIEMQLDCDPVLRRAVSYLEEK